MKALPTLLLAGLALVLAGCAAPPVPAQAPIIGGVQCGPQQYPFNALQDFARGPVGVRAEVGAFGELVHGYVEQPTVNPYLNAGALEALRHCRLHGQPPGTTVHLVVLYELGHADEYLPRGFVTVVPAPPPVK